MINRKGPFGSYATEILTPDISVFEYAMAVINGKRSGCFLPCIINRYGEAKEFSYDFSGLIPLSEFECTASKDQKKFPSSLMYGKRLRQRRIAVGTFLLQIGSLLNDLLPPEGVILSPKHIYTDNEGTVLKCCYRPIEYNDPQLRLSSIDAADMESLMSTLFFSQVLNEDEKQTILHAISTCDEEMYCTCCKILLSEQGQRPGSSASVSSRTYGKRGSSKSDLSIRRDLIIPALTCVCAVYSYLSIGIKASIIFSFAGLILALRVIYKDRTAQGPSRSSPKDDRLKKGQLRAKILFSQTPARSASEPDGTSAPPSNEFDYNIRYASIQSTRSDKNGTEDAEPVRYSIYTDKVTIGSDRFLADIVIEDDSVDSQHASITFEDDRYYLTDLSVSHNTFIDDKALVQDRRYEIKNNQKLTFGKSDFIFKISSAQNTGSLSDQF